MSGAWVIVCGPSGAGKDSVLAWAREALAPHPAICFAQRLVTRAQQPGSEHEEISLQGLRDLQQRGELAWRWEAHGHAYGVRATYASRVREGDVVVVNGSREHARDLAGRDDVRCVMLTAPPDVLEQRLRLRGREDASGVASRMARNAAQPAPFADRVIVNGGALEQAGGALRDYLLELARPS